MQPQLRSTVTLSVLGLLLLSGLVSRPAAAALDFGCVRLGKSKDLVLKYRTYGDPLMVDRVGITGAAAADFKIIEDHMTGGPYSSGTIISVKIRFAPKAAEVRNATFSGSCHTVREGHCTFGSTALTGIGLDHVTITEVISEQFPGNECNSVRRGGPARLFMATQSGTNAALSVRAEVKPEEARAKMKIGVRMVGRSDILGRAPLSDDKTVVSFKAQDGENLYEVIAWCDKDDPKPGEEDDRFSPEARVITKADYDAADRFVQRVVSDNAASYPISSGLLEAFRTDGLPRLPGVVAGTNIIRTGDLTHPVGAIWRADCTAVAPLFTFPKESALAREAARYLWEKKFWYREELEPRRHIIEGWFAAHPGATLYVSPPTWGWKPIGFNYHPDLFLAFGRVTINNRRMQMWVVRTPVGLKIVRIRFSGNFNDLYDFYYGSPFEPARRAAVLQAGFGTLGGGGRVFRTRVQFEGDITL